MKCIQRATKRIRDIRIHTPDDIPVHTQDNIHAYTRRNTVKQGVKFIIDKIYGEVEGYRCGL